MLAQKTKGLLYLLCFAICLVLTACEPRVIVVTVEPPEVDIGAVGTGEFKPTKEVSEPEPISNDASQEGSSTQSDDEPTRADTTQRVSFYQSEYMIGESANGRNIYATQLGDGPRGIVLVGGMHAGFAPGSVDLAEQAISHFDDPDYIPSDISLYIIANANPDSEGRGVEQLEGRLNGNNVDINRNWGCNWSSNAVWRNESIGAGRYAFSEPETQALRDFFESVDPEVVIFFEARGGIIAPGVCNGRSNAQSLANWYGNAAGYEVREITGYTLTGDVSDWLVSQGTPSFAILLSNYTATDWSKNREGIEAIIAYISR